MNRAVIFLMFITFLNIYVTECQDIGIQNISPGDGRTFARKGQKVFVHYTGTLENGKEFDSSRKRSSPFSFRLGVGEVIKCWDEGVAKLSVGQRVKLTCPADKAYGNSGISGLIPPRATLFFDVEFIRVAQ